MRASHCTPLKCRQATTTISAHLLALVVLGWQILDASNKVRTTICFGTEINVQLQAIRGAGNIVTLNLVTDRSGFRESPRLSGCLHYATAALAQRLTCCRVSFAGEATLIAAVSLVILLVYRAVVHEIIEATILWLAREVLVLHRNRFVSRLWSMCCDRTIGFGDEIMTAA